MLRQYGQTLTVQGAGLIKSPYVFREQYDIGDYITLSFSDKTAKVQITSVTEQISWNNKTLSFTFGKPVNGLDRQLDLMLKKIQSASSATSEASTNSVKWYTTPTDTAQDAGDVTFNTLGFTGSGGTFTLYLDDEKTGSKSYHLYIKNLTASLVLTTNKGATDLTLISGSYIANIFVDEDGNIINQGMTAVDSVVSGNTQPVTSDAVYDAISSAIGTNPDVSNATGVLPIAHGGTGKTTAQDACNELINGLSTGDSVPVDDDYAITQYVNGGTTTKTYHRRKMIHIWEYIKGKIQSVALTIGTTTSAIAETLYGSLTVKNSSGTTTASISQEGSISGKTLYANNYQLKRYYEIDLSSLSTSNFYPVTFASTDLELDCEIHSPNLGGSASYNQNLIHFLLIAQGWSDTPKRFTVLSSGRFDANETTIGCVAYGNQGGVNCVWLRGGTLYRFYCNREPTLHTSDYSNGNEKFTVGTNYYGGSNSNLTVCWTPGNFSSMYTINGIQASLFTGDLNGTAYKIRTSAPSSPSNGDIWIL